jgi:hypothetical protein
MASLTPETFLAVAEMVAAHLRLKEVDRWTPHVCRLKFHSFTSEFPEISEAQFMWAAERWIQGLDSGFHRYPTWRELMAPLFRCEAGLANRSWGPRPDLPAFVAFKPDQLAQLPGQPQSQLPPPDSHNSGAYAVTAPGRPALPAGQSEEARGITDEDWQAYLASVAEWEAAQRHAEAEACSP